MAFSWRTIFDWLLKIVASIGDFGKWLFTEHTATDAFGGLMGYMSKPFGQNDNPSWIQNTIEIVKEFLKTNTPSLYDWAEGVSFTPIQIIGVTGLTIIVVISFVKLWSIFA